VVADPPLARPAAEAKVPASESRSAYRWIVAMVKVVKKLQQLFPDEAPREKQADVWAEALIV